MLPRNIHGIYTYVYRETKWKGNCYVIVLQSKTLLGNVSKNNTYTKLEIPLQHNTDLLN